MGFKIAVHIYIYIFFFFWGGGGGGRGGIQGEKDLQMQPPSQMHQVMWNLYLISKQFIITKAACAQLLV